MFLHFECRKRCFSPLWASYYKNKTTTKMVLHLIAQKRQQNNPLDFLNV